MSAMVDFPLETIAISGPTLASLIQRLSFSPGDVDGLLFGQVTRIFPSNLSDDSPGESVPLDASSSDSASKLVATVTGFFCSGSILSFHDPLGRIDPRRIDSLVPDVGSRRHILGWFSARRKTSNRTSMREFSVTSSLASQFSLPIEDSQNPRSISLSSGVFLLFTTPLNDQLIHTHEYRAYQFCASMLRMEPRSVNIVNIGPAFRGHYESFSPISPFPLLNCEPRSSAIRVESDLGSLSARKQAVKDQKEIDAIAEGFQVADLNRIVGTEASKYSGGLEDLYGKMLVKIESLARAVEKSSAKVAEQENQNQKLRYRAAKIEG